MNDNEYRDFRISIRLMNYKNGTHVLENNSFINSILFCTPHIELF